MRPCVLKGPPTACAYHRQGRIESSIEQIFRQHKAHCLHSTRRAGALAATKRPQQARSDNQHDTKPVLRHQGDKQSGASRIASPNKKEDEDKKQGISAVAPYALGLGVAVLLGSGFLFRHEIRGYVDNFIQTVDQLGPLGYGAYGLLYVLLEIVAVPAIPLTMTAGVIFGIVPGTMVVSAASVAAATIAFLIARYAARDKISELASGNHQFQIIDRAIRKNSFKIVALLRLSPLLPLALSNYFYGLTSVDLPSYVVASWLGMLPGTIAYVTAGSYGRTALDEGRGELALEWWQVALGAAFTAAALAYLGKIAKAALDEAENDAAAEKA